MALYKRNRQKPWVWLYFWFSMLWLSIGFSFPPDPDQNSSYGTSNRHMLIFAKSLEPHDDKSMIPWLSIELSDVFKIPVKDDLIVWLAHFYLLFYFCSQLVKGLRLEKYYSIKEKVWA